MIDLVWPNIIAVVVATIVAFVIGAIWFAPQVMGKTWLGLMGKSDDDWKKNRNKAIGFGFIGNLISALFLGLVIDSLGGSGLMDGLEVGFLVWLGFPAMVYFTSWAFEGRHNKLFGIEMAHSLLIFLVMGAILGVWA